MKRRPGRRRLVLADRHQTWAPSKISIDSPARAAGRSPSSSRACGRGSSRGAWAWTAPWRRSRPITWTSKSSSTACRICVLCASGWTRNEYLRSSIMRVALLRDDRREQDLVRMEAHVALPCTCSSADSRDQERLRADELVHLELGRNRDRPRASRLRNDLISASSSGCATTQQRRSLPQAPTSSAAAFVRRRVERRRIEHAERAGLRVGGERAAQRRAAGLAVHLRRRSCASSAGRRRRRRSSAARGSCRRGRGRCPSGATASSGRRRRGRGSCAPRVPARGRVQLGAHGLVHEVRLHLDAEDGLLERDALRGLARRVEQRSLRRCHGCLSSLTSTKPFFGPGTAPLTSSRFRSASTSCTVSPTCVTRLPPMRPAIFIALEDARRSGRGADRARLADVVRAVRDRAAVEVVALDRAGEALADPDPGDLDRVARLEDLDGDGLADGQLASCRGTRPGAGAGPTLAAGGRARPS